MKIFFLLKMVTKSHACKTKHVKSLPLINMSQTCLKHVYFAAIVLLMIGPPNYVNN